jgi:hypothetical protein
LAVVAVELTDAPLAGVPPHPDNDKQELEAIKKPTHQRPIEKTGRLFNPGSRLDPRVSTASFFSTGDL